MIRRWLVPGAPALGEPVALTAEADAAVAEIEEVPVGVGSAPLETPLSAGDLADRAALLVRS